MLNTHVNNFTMEEALQATECLLEQPKAAYVVAVNVDVIIKIEHDPYLRKIIDEADICLVDGKPLVWLARQEGYPVKEKVSGSDLVPELCRRAAGQGKSIFILGGAEGVAHRAGQNLLKAFPGLRIAGTYAPPMGFEHSKTELDKINNMLDSSAPDYLFACLGCPKQEKWVYENIGKSRAKVFVCAGATVDFLAGKINRAPKWMSEHGLEWLYRMTQDPNRLVKRYLVDDMKIFRLAWRYRNK